MAKPKIKPPIRPVMPVAPVTPQIAPLPASAQDVASDRELLEDLERLKRLGVTHADRFLAAYKAFGDEFKFQDTLRALVDAFPHTIPPSEIDSRFYVHLARLAAEAYVFDIDPEIDQEESYLHLFFTDSLSHLNGLSEHRRFIHFVARRLVVMSSASLDTTMQRIQLEKAAALFNFMRRELAAEYNLSGISNTQLEQYRLLLFKVIQKHYQLLADHLFKTARGAKYKQALKQLDEMFEILDGTDRPLDPPPHVAAFRLEKKTFRDYFDPKKASDFNFAFFTKGAPDLTDDGPEVLFHDVLVTRHAQRVFQHDVRPGLHRPGSHVFPDPPRLHDNKSWQEWARKMWDSALRGKATQDALTELCGYLTRYFNVLSAHVPFDLEEGGKTPSYLTRRFPRAITGSVVHDCLVYAARGIFILGRLFAAATKPSSLSDPKIWMIEMPVHVGVMIRMNLTGSIAKKDALVVINNQSVTVIELDPADTLNDAAAEVVKGMYGGLKTTVLIHEITAKITDAKSLWKQVNKIASRPSVLPYKDPMQPELAYLLFSAESAKIAKDLKRQLGALFYPMSDRLAGVKPADRTAAYEKELTSYSEAIDAAFNNAKHEFDHIAKSRADEIREDLDANLHRAPKGSEVIDTKDALHDWEKERVTYKLAIQVAKRALDLHPIDPEVLLAHHGFPEAVQ
ncbi:MAG TPA: hypothetical protein VIV11_14365 [Kofleriaceae bacterium]